MQRCVTERDKISIRIPAQIKKVPFFLRMKLLKESVPQTQVEHFNRETVPLSNFLYTFLSILQLYTSIIGPPINNPSFKRNHFITQIDSAPQKACFLP